MRTIILEGAFGDGKTLRSMPIVYKLKELGTASKYIARSANIGRIGNTIVADTSTVIIVNRVMTGLETLVTFFNCFDLTANFNKAPTCNGFVHCCPFSRVVFHCLCT